MNSPEGAHLLAASEHNMAPLSLHVSLLVLHTRDSPLNYSTSGLDRPGTSLPSLSQLPCSGRVRHWGSGKGHTPNSPGLFKAAAPTPAQSQVQASSLLAWYVSQVPGLELPREQRSEPHSSGMFGADGTASARDGGHCGEVAPAPLIC